MFTGLIQGQGEIAFLRKTGDDSRLRVIPQFAMPDLCDGESIAVNGVCLSVEEHENDGFTAYASGETLARSTLGNLARGDLVNLERALTLHDRLGGHLVSGHVDCLAVVVYVRPSGQSLRCRLKFPEEFGPEVVAKGSVALDGISLTVNDSGADYLEVNIIPDTQKRTTMRLWRPGVPVNMETDILGKYVRRMLDAWAGQAGGRGAPPSLSLDLLRRNGFA